jgi:hypothetical protein
MSIPTRLLDRVQRSQRGAAEQELAFEQCAIQGALSEHVTSSHAYAAIPHMGDEERTGQCDALPDSTPDQPRLYPGRNHTSVFRLK